MLLCGPHYQEVPMSSHTPIRLAAAALAMLTLTACTRLSPETQVVADAAEAMGGADRIQAVRSLTVEGSGRDLAVGGSVTPEAPPNVNLVADYRRTLEVASPRLRTRQTRTAQYRFANAVVVRQDQGLDGDVAYNVPASAQPSDPPPAAQRAGANAARDRRQEWLRHPLVLVRAALDPAAKITNLRTEDDQPHVDVALPSGDMVTLAVDPATKLPSHITARAYDPNWGDVIIEAQFSNYQEVGGLRLPATIVTKQDQWTTSERTLAKQSVDGDAADLAAPEAVKPAAPPTPPGAHRAGGRGGERHLVAARVQPPQRGVRVRRPHHLVRSAAGRGAHQGGDRESAYSAARQAGDSRGSQPPPSGSLRRIPHRGGRGADDHHPADLR